MKWLIFFFLLLEGPLCKPQALKITRYNAGCRTFEIDGVGNNPLTIAPLLKNPTAYQNYIHNIQYSGIFGNPGTQILRDYYMNVEWQRNPSESRFWKKHSLQTGFFVSSQLVKDKMGFENERYVVAPGDTAFYQDQYFVAQEQQFIGANIGLNKRARISNKLQFLTGVYIQGGFAFVHKYSHLWDSSVFRNQTWTSKITVLPSFEGKNFFQWQGMIPLGLEMDVYHKMIFLRMELDIGIVQDRYRNTPSKKEAHGFGCWLVYQPKSF
jgi:hypothetical protein